MSEPSDPAPAPPLPPAPPRRSAVAPVVLGLAITLLIGVAIKRAMNSAGSEAGRSDRSGQADASGGPHTNVLADFGPIADFTLTDKEGKPFSLADLRGRISVVDFVFTTCSGPCIPMTQGMRTIFHGVQSLPDVDLVTITVDPETDTPEVLTRFAQTSGADNPRWHWLTGDKKTIRELAQNSFYASVGDKLPTGEVPHSTLYFVVDRNARLRVAHDTQTPPEPGHSAVSDVVEAVKTLVAQQPRPAPANK